MRPQISEQVLVIVGASSGIGRETALRAGKQGASVVLAARNVEALRVVAHEIELSGGKAHVIPIDVSDWSQVQQLATAAVNRFGRIDTWVNDAAVSLYGTVDQTSVEEFARIIQVNLMGTIYGVKAVLPTMEKQGSGTIINIGSVASERSLPLQAAYSTTKHAVRGFSDALRVELQHDHPDIHVTLIMPASVNTPFFDHARSKMETEPAPVPPVYAPHLVAEAILFAAEHPRREIIVGGGGKLLSLVQKLSPAAADWLMLKTGFSFQKRDEPNDGQDNLFAPLAETGSSTGKFGNQANNVSPATKLDLYPNLKRVFFAATVSIFLLLVRRAGR